MVAAAALLLPRRSRLPAAALAAGLAVVLLGPAAYALATETREKLAAGVTPALFDLSQEREKFDDEELLQRALAAADSLRITEQENQEKVS